LSTKRLSQRLKSLDGILQYVLLCAKINESELLVYCYYI